MTIELRVAMRLGACSLAAALAAGAVWAQEAATPAMAPASAPEPGSAADAAAGSPAPSQASAQLPSTGASAPAPEGCRPVTDKAMAADLRALTAQSQKADVSVQAQMFGAAGDLWTQAVAQCEGRAKERARRNLADNQRTSASLQEQIGAGPECASAHKDGAALQELARQALVERRWSDAANLFDKSEDTWDLATERCTGSQRELAEHRRAQTELDGYNAEHCAPLFDRAREYTQKMRANAANLSKEERQDGLMMAETLWRDTSAQCHGSAAKDSASNNAQALARERGTPFVAKSIAPLAVAPRPGTSPSAALPGPRPAATAPAKTAQAATGKPANASASGPAVPVAAAANATATPGLSGAALANAFSAAFPSASKSDGAAPSAGSTASAPDTAATPGSVAATPAPATPAPATPQPPSFNAGSTHFEGQFVADAGGQTFSGHGKISWANGDSYDGDLVHGQRHGKGLFIWANGNRFQGDWAHDVASGTGTLEFANGNLYVGQVLDATPKGHGKMRYGSGDRYEGEFSAGVPQGRGLYVWKNGQQFDGDWVAGQPHGKGTLKFASGDVYSGDMREGVQEGEGQFLWTNGDQYNGHWSHGKKNGAGRFTWKSGDYWTGQYDNDQQTLNGQLVQK